MKPRKTEFKGVTYRSKTEAQTALLFYMNAMKVFGEELSWWEYEPSAFRTKDYVPDFLLMTTQDPYRTDWRVIEVKPTEATKTYMAELSDRFLELASSDFVLRLEQCGVFVHFELWTGGFYGKDDRCCWYWGEDYGFDYRATADWMDSFSLEEDEVEMARTTILAHRFDLVERCVSC